MGHAVAPAPGHAYVFQGEELGMTNYPWTGIAINVAAQAGDPDSVLAHYRRLIALRHDEPVVVHGDFALLLPDDPQVYAFTRRLGDTALLVLCNVSGAPAAPDVPGWSAAELLLGTHGTSPLRPWESRVLRRVTA